MPDLSLIRKVDLLLDSPAIPTFARDGAGSHPLSRYFWLIGKLGKAAFGFFPERDGRAAWFRLKFVIRGLAYARWMKPWLEFLDTDSMRPVAAKYPRLNLKIQWPYLNSGYGPTQRLAIVLHHYQFALSHFSPALITRLIGERFLYLARWNAGDMGSFSLRLSHENKFSQEGEMVLGLYQDGTERLCALLCFTISAPGEISIGCSQGGRPDTTRDEIPGKEFVIALTRRMHGSRPKNLLLFALRRLARAWSIDRLKAISTGRHIWRAKLQSDYDAFWEETGGTLGPDGMYDIPSSSDFRPLDEIKPKKRAMYRHRYEFLGALGQEIENAVGETDHLPVVLDVHPSKAMVALDELKNE